MHTHMEIPVLLRISGSGDDGCQGQTFTCFCLAGKERNHHSYRDKVAGMKIKISTLNTSLLTGTSVMIRWAMDAPLNFLFAYIVR